MTRTRWGQDDCITFALPDLERSASPKILKAFSEAWAVRRASREYGSIRAAWEAGLEHCGYREVSGVAPDQGEHRFLGEDFRYGWTVGVLMEGGVWVRAPGGRVRAMWKDGSPIAHWWRPV